MQLGWIKLHRKVTEWEWYKEPNTFRVFVHLLIRASAKQYTWRGVDLELGELPTGVAELSNQLGLTQGIIRGCLTRLESTGEITQKTNNKGRIITIVKFKEYQVQEQKKVVKTTRKKPIPKKVVIPTLNEFLQYAKDKDLDYEMKRSALIKKYQSWVENDWKTGHDKKIVNWKSTLLNTLPHVAKDFSKKRTL